MNDDAIFLIVFFCTAAVSGLASAFEARTQVPERVIAAQLCDTSIGRTAFVAACEAIESQPLSAR